MAMRQLALGLRRGLKMPRHYYLGYVWSNIAVAAGDKISESVREEILSASLKHGVLSGKKIAEAQLYASELWVEKVSKALLKKQE